MERNGLEGHVWVTEYVQTAVAWCEQNISPRTGYIPFHAGVTIKGDGWKITTSGFLTFAYFDDDSNATFARLKFDQLIIQDGPTTSLPLIQNDIRSR